MKVAFVIATLTRISVRIAIAKWPAVAITMAIIRPRDGVPLRVRDFGRVFQGIWMVWFDCAAKVTNWGFFIEVHTQNLVRRASAEENRVIPLQVIVGVVMGVFICCLVGSCICICVRRRRKRREREGRREEGGQVALGSVGAGEGPMRVGGGGGG